MLHEPLLQILKFFSIFCLNFLPAAGSDLGRTFSFRQLFRIVNIILFEFMVNQCLVIYDQLFFCGRMQKVKDFVELVFNVLFFLIFLQILANYVMKSLNLLLPPNF